MLTDKCIVGLGNPGLKYFNTRHNIGFQVIDKLAEFFKIEKFDTEDIFLAAGAEYEDKRLVLLKPLTYMNSSGKAVALFSERYELKPENFLIIYDDVNIGFGTLRLRPGGSDGGQNGMASVIYEMESDSIPRLRIGIRNDEEIEKLKDEYGTDLAKFVLSKFTDDESEKLEKVIVAAKEAVLLYIREGMIAAMNSFNRSVIAE